MRIVAPAILLSALVLGFASCAQAADSKADPSQYTLTAHVSAAEYPLPIDIGNEILTVAIDGKHYRMIGGTAGHGLINPGDYRAQPTKPVLVVSKYANKNAFESALSFELLFPDGTTRRFDVIAQWE